MIEAVFLFLFLGRVADIASTFYFLKQGVLIEGNPSVQWQMDTFGKFWPVVNMAAVAGVFVASYYAAGLVATLWAAGLLGVLSFAVAAWNFYRAGAFR